MKVHKYYYVILSLILTVACGGTDSNSNDDGGDPTPEVNTCSTSSDCETDYYCYYGECEEGASVGMGESCDTDNDCDPSNMIYCMPGFDGRNCDTKYCVEVMTYFGEETGAPQTEDECNEAGFTWTEQDDYELCAGADSLYCESDEPGQTKLDYGNDAPDTYYVIEITDLTSTELLYTTDSTFTPDEGESYSEYSYWLGGSEQTSDESYWEMKRELCEGELTCSTTVTSADLADFIEDRYGFTAEDWNDEGRCVEFYTHWHMLDMSNPDSDVSTGVDYGTTTRLYYIKNAEGNCE